MRVFATVVVAFAAAGCASEAPIGATTAAATAVDTNDPPSSRTDIRCSWQADAPGDGLGVADEYDPWIGANPPFGYVVTTRGRADAAGNYNYQISGYDQTLQTLAWAITVTPDAVGYYQTLPESIPFVSAPAQAIEPAAIPVQGGDDGVGQVGSVSVPLGGDGNGNGAAICILYKDWVNLASHECVPQATLAETCGTCGSGYDDCNISRYCGTCASNAICLGHHCFVPKPFNPPCSGRCI